MLTRRQTIATLGGAAALGALGFGGPAVAKARLGDDGLYQLDWYLESFLDLADDLATASRNGKRFAILWGLKGCPSCKRMHEVHLIDPKIEGYIKDNFDILHLNILGAREVTDFDGKKLGEKAFASAYDVPGTPTIQFFPETVAALAAGSGQAREITRMTGLLEPPDFLAMFRYVREKGYDTVPFATWLKKQA